MARRLPSPPPVLPGFSFVHVLGSGGFADVFLYEQNMPRRQVAVKVMLSEVVDEQVRQMFRAEANLMAQLSSHPAILTVYEAGVSGDGRPYLVMEVCAPTIAERYRRDRIPVAEVLRTGVRVASAVETAHRAGVLHRDIKPSNILTTAYGHPVLADFGIASTLQSVQTDDTVGLSVPWSAPEVLLDETPGTVASEVWSLGATVYSLLAGRSPFEDPGGSNSSADLMARIARGRPRPIDRDDVPASLEQLVRRAMSRRPDQRPASALEFARELQAVEAELGLPQTQVEVARDDWATGTVADAEDRTVLRPVAGAAPASVGRRRRRRAAEQYDPVGTLRDGSLPRRFSNSRPSAPGRSGRATTWARIGGAVLVVVLGVTAVLALIRPGTDDGIPVVTDIAATETGGTVAFSWPDPGLDEGDLYQITVDGVASSIQGTARFVVDAEPGDTVCLIVTVNRDGRLGAPSGEKCVDVVDG